MSNRVRQLLLTLLLFIVCLFLGYFLGGLFL
jgi:hypothetical protein